MPGLHTDSESGSDGPSSTDCAENGSCSPANSSLVASRLRRTRLALSLLQGAHWGLLHREREHHRRFVIRSGHIGSRDGAHAAAVRREALRQTQARRCAAPGCEAHAIELCAHCFVHVCRERGQQLYRLDDDACLPRLVIDEDSDVEEVSDVTPSAAAPFASESGSGANMDEDADMSSASVSNSRT